MKLYAFAVSHYSEKARWALDHARIRYVEHTLMPGPHMVRIRRIAPRSALPVLVDGRQVVQGSSEIVDHVEGLRPDRSLTPEDGGLAARCRELEARIDGELGRALRRLFYLHALGDRAFALRFFLERAPAWGRLFYGVAYDRLSAGIRKAYRVSAEREADDVRIVEAVLDELESDFASTGYLETASRARTWCSPR